MTDAKTDWRKRTIRFAPLAQRAYFNDGKNADRLALLTSHNIGNADELTGAALDWYNARNKNREMVLYSVERYVSLLLNEKVQKDRLGIAVDTFFSKYFNWLYEQPLPAHEQETAPNSVTEKEQNASATLSERPGFKRPLPRLVPVR